MLKGNKRAHGSHAAPVSSRASASNLPTVASSSGSPGGVDPSLFLQHPMGWQPVQEERPSDPLTAGTPRLCSAAAANVLVQKLRQERSLFSLEPSSVYGAGILIPQLGRTAGWPKTLVYFTCKTYFYVLLNYFMQATLLLALSKEQNVMDLFQGEPFLCDFGASIGGCPDAANCLGPGGTRISAPRVYDFSLWSTRTFVRDSLKALFPDREHEIHDKIDPGEYGAESQKIRWLCCFLFMFEVMNELTLIFNMGCLLYAIPTSPQPWFKEEESPAAAPRAAASRRSSQSRRRSSGFSYREGDEAGEDEESDEDDEATREAGGVDIKVQIAGMTAPWKAVNVIVLLIPKIVLWHLTAEVGVTYLMETSALGDMIVNSIALTFILQIDETICSVLMNKSVLHMLSECEPFEWTDAASEEDDASMTPRQSHVNDSLQCWQGLYLLFPVRLTAALVLTGCFILLYYWRKCRWRSDGWWWVSQEVYRPTSTNYNLLNALLPFLFPLEYQETAAWVMPDEH